jgi:serine/threonine-protein kinase
MGMVYRAEDETLRRTVALKVLPDASENEERRQRFLREARSAAAISHPNVAVVHQVGEARWAHLHRHGAGRR